MQKQRRRVISQDVIPITSDDIVINAQNCGNSNGIEFDTDNSFYSPDQWFSKLGLGSPVVHEQNGNGV